MAKFYAHVEFNIEIEAIDSEQADNIASDWTPEHPQQDPDAHYWQKKKVSPDLVRVDVNEPEEGDEDDDDDWDDYLFGDIEPGEED